MNFNLTKEQKLIQAAAREFAEKYVAPAAEQIERENRIPESIIKGLAELDFLPCLMRRNTVELMLDMTAMF
jgi:butyryl-CoA dehydrogenase (EC 1.3.99.2)